MLAYVQKPVTQAVIGVKHLSAVSRRGFSPAMGCSDTIDRRASAVRTFIGIRGEAVGISGQGDSGCRAASPPRSGAIPDWLLGYRRRRRWKIGIGQAEAWIEDAGCRM